MPDLTEDVLVSEGVLEQLTAWAEAAAPHETGGILLGMLAGDRRWITGARQIAPSNAKRNRYRLPAGVTNGLVLEARRADPRVGYLGDWHSHPADSGASGIDLGTFRRLLYLALTHAETAPVLAVVRREASGWQLDMTTAAPWPFRPQPIAVTFAGQPSPADPTDASEARGDPNDGLASTR
jgi:hypothetical protein